MKDAWHVVTLFLLGSLAVLIVTHAPGFSQAAGTIFSGFNSWGTTLSGTNVKNAVYAGKVTH